LASLERDHVPRSSPLAVKETQLIDRTEEMRLLREAVDSAILGQGGVAFLYGEAGIGKTRLARELGAYARLKGMKVLSGRCPALFRMDGVPPYILWREVVKDYMETCTPEQLYRVIGHYPAEVAKLVPELKQMIRTVPESFELSPEHSRDRLFEAMSQFITNISRETPLLVILDDLQWTDESSLLLLHYLARGTYKEPLFLLGAYRDTDVDEKHPLIPVLTELNRERLLQSVQLKRMSFDDTSEMIKQILEQDDVPREFCELVYEKTRGNPFFLEEVITSLKEEEVIYAEDNKWKIKEASKIEFPETVRSVIKKRISRLGDECQSVLSVASFIGKDFTFEALCAVAGIEENKLLEMMERMFKTGLFKHRVVHGEDICSFADVIVRDVVYEEVNPLRRKKLHGIVGHALEKAYAEKIDEHFGELASHFLESGDKEKALDYFLKAGEKATGIYANAEAASYFQSALKLLYEKEGELRKRGDVLERLGGIKSLIGEYDACMKYWNEALLLWEQLGEKEKASRLHRKMSNVLWGEMGETEKGKEHQERALEILGKEPESVELASLYADMARLSWHTGNMDRARSCAEKGLEMAKKMDAFEVIAQAYTNLALVFNATGEPKRAIQCLERALKIALDNSYMETALRVYNNLADNLSTEEIERSLELWEKGFELAKKVGHTSWISWMGTALAGMYVGLGNTNQALLLAEQSVALGRRTHNLSGLSLSLGNLGYVYMVLGEWDKSEQYYKEALDISQKLNRFQDMARSYAYLGYSCLLAREEYARAKGFCEKSCEICEKAGAKSYKMLFSQGLIASCIELGQIDMANKLLDDLHKYAIDVKDRYLISAAYSLRAQLFRAQKKWNESVEHCDKALREWEALNYRQRDAYFFARLGLYEYARVYMERDQEGDKEKATSLLNQALEIFQKMGAKKDIEKVEAKLLYIETGEVAPVPKPMSQIATGYSDLDKLLYGGIPPNCAVALTSPSCDERDMLIKSFLEVGAKKGEVTFYVTIDPSVVRGLTKESSSTFYLFVCNPQAEAIVKSSPNVFTLKGVENLTDISIALTSAIHRLDPSLKGPRRICIGLISDLLLQHHAVQTRRWLTGLISELRSNGFTTLAVMDPEMHPPQEVRAVLDLFEGEINIYEKETEKGSEKYLKIKKMSNQKYIANEIALTKTSEVS
jgi:predicted ATPase/KaiC/GvpD/RAD55 family RecA-like ATPase